MNDNQKIWLAVTSMVLGIFSLLFVCCFWYVTVLTSIISITLACISITTKKAGTGMAVAGLTTSVISLVTTAIIILTGLSIFSLFSSFGDDSDSYDKSYSSSADNYDDSDEKCLVATKCWFDTDYAGKDAIVVQFEWTNIKNKSANFAFSIDINAYQNGIELDNATGCDSVDSGNSYKDVLPNATITITEAYILDDTSNVNIIAKKFILGDEILNETINLDIDVLPAQASTEETSVENTTNNDEATESNNDSNNGLSTEQIKNAIENGDYSLVTPEFKETMDSYEAFYNNYFDFMEKYNSDDADVFGMLNDYLKMLDDLDKWTSKIDSINVDELSPADSAYFFLITLRIEKRIIEIAL